MDLGDSRHLQNSVWQGRTARQKHLDDGPYDLKLAVGRAGTVSREAG